ncbi:helix-turn-helix domain-containing protein [Pseudokineococcus sp. 1T1Z-3]|uniref:helix-turn-helix domain-containing protein n=1 Tax=Pseudokineococcus sp. 1T1Z-3 TaxID=3132745 RepID=UPI003097A530
MSLSPEVWDLLGLDALARDLYLRLLQAPEEGLEAHAAAVGVPTHVALAGLEALVAARLVHRSGGDFAPADPRRALVALARSRQSLLDGVGPLADELGTVVEAARLQASPHEFFSVLRGAPAVLGGAAAVLRGAVHEVVGTVTPPFVAGDDDEVLAAQRGLLDRGISFRAVYDSSVLETAELREHVVALATAGEQSRVSVGVGTKMLVADGATALLPLARGDSTEVSALLLGRSALTDALQQLFELLWRRSQPVLMAVEEDGAVGRGLEPHLARALRLLASGMSDAGVAAALGVSGRTLRRWVSELHDRLGTTNRVQLGMAAARTRRPGPPEAREG